MKSTPFIACAAASVLFLLLALQAPAIAQGGVLTISPKSEHDELVNVTAQGESELSWDQAEERALRNALRKGAGVWIVSQTQVEDFELRRDTIYSRAKGYIVSYEQTRKYRGLDDTYVVEIEAVVSLSKLKDHFLRGLSTLIEWKGRPAFAPYVTVKQGAPEGLARWLETAITGAFQKAGHTVVDSEVALQVAAEVMGCINNEAHQASAELADERGVFPAFAGSIYDVPDGPRMRNASATTIAPTGTLSIIAGCSSGIEPLFALSYTRNILDGARLVEVNSYFEEAAKKEGFYSEELMQQLASGVKLHDVAEVPNSVKRLFVTAHEITPEWHVRMQAAFQRSTHNAVSKTVNFPQQATREAIAKVYMMAYQDGLKGITIYRDRSRDAQVLTTGKKEEKAEGAGRTPRKRAKITTGVTERVTTGCGPLYVTVNSDEQGICEVFSTLGKAGGCASAQLESTCRLISLALRAGVDVSSVVRQLRGIRCPSIAWEEGKSVLSCADAIASVLEKHVRSNNKEGAKLEATPTNKGNSHDGDKAMNIAGQCPDCGNLLVYQEGCFICPSCGYTKC